MRNVIFSVLHDRIALRTVLIGACCCASSSGRAGEPCNVGPIDWNVLGDLNGAVHGATVYNSSIGPRVCIGGTFTMNGQSSINKVAKQNGQGFLPLGEGLTGSIYAMAGYIDPDTGETLLFAGGENQMAAGFPYEQAAFVWRNDEYWDGWGTTALQGTVYALEVVDLGDGPRVMAGGDFTFFVPNNETAFPNLAVYDGLYSEMWNPFFWADGEGGQVDLDVPAPIYAIASWDDGSGPKLFIGGAFDAVGMQPTWGIAGWEPESETWFDLSLGVSDSDGDPGQVRALKVFDDGVGEALYVGGLFDNAFGVASPGIARWNGIEGSSVGGGVPEEYLPCEVRSLEVFDAGNGPALFVGGLFSIDPPFNLGAPGILKWDGSTWSEVDMGVGGSVLAMSTNTYGSRNALYVGGSFTDAGGKPGDNAAAYGWEYNVLQNEVHYALDVDGDWDYPLSWSIAPNLPDEQDHVCINVSPGVTVHTGDFDTAIQSVHCTGHLWIDATHPSWEFIVEQASDIDTLRMSGGTFETHAEVITNAVQWNGGQLYDPTFDNDEIEGTIVVQDTLDIYGDDEKTLRTNLVIADTGIWSNTGDIDVGKITGSVVSSVTIDPGAELLIQTDSDMTYDLGASGHIPLFNNGTLTKFAGADDGLTQLRVNFINTGDVFVKSGTLDLFGYGTYTGAIHVAPEAALIFGYLPANNTHVLESGSLLEAQGDVTMEGSRVTIEPGATVNLEGAFNVAGNTPTLTLNTDLTVPVLNYTPVQDISATTIAGAGSLTVMDSMLWTNGYLAPDGGVTSMGDLELSGPDNKRLQEPLTNSGSAIWLGGNMVLYNNPGLGHHGGITNASGATFDILADAQIDVPGGHHPFFDNHGLLTKSAGNGDGVFHYEGDLNNYGNIEILSGALAVDGDQSNSVFTQFAGETTLLGGDLITLNASATDIPAQIDGGVVNGTQSIIGDVVNAAGIFQPGAEMPGTLTVDGAYTQQRDATLAIEIGDVIAGTTNDELHVTGVATLGGALHVDLLNGLSPDVGTSFTVLTSDTGIVGQFDSVLGDGDWELLYSDTIVFVTLVKSPTCPEDISGDGIVGISDLLTLLANWGLNASGAELAEPINTVDVADLLALLSKWGDCP